MLNSMYVGGLWVFLSLLLCLRLVNVHSLVVPVVPTNGLAGSQIFVCANKWCREKGSEATMATFTFLTPPTVPVVSVNCLGRCNKGPNCRILTSEGAFVEASMVRSVETVVDLLQTHLNLAVNVTSAKVLDLNYEGNVHLRNGDLDSAIECYDRALELGDREQEGVLLVMRGTALLQRAYSCRMRSKDLSAIANELLPSIEGTIYITTSYSHSFPLTYEYITILSMNCFHPLRVRLTTNTSLYIAISSIIDSLPSPPLSPLSLSLSFPPSFPYPVLIRCP